MNDQTQPPAVRPRWGRRIVLLAGIVLIVLVAAVVLAGPAIGGSIARGMVSRLASERISGGVEVDRVSLSWFGPQAVSGLTILDESGSQIGRLDASAGAGLVALATGSRDLGVVTLGGELSITQRADGSWDIERALASPTAPAAPKPAPAPPSPTTPEPPSVPAGLAMSIDARDLEITATFADGRTVALRNIEATGAFATGAPVEIEATADDGAGRRAITLTLTADRLTTGSGELALSGSNLSVDVNVRVSAGDLATIAGVAPSPNDEDLFVTGAVTERGGRIQLSDASRPLTVSFRPPHELLQRGATEGAAVSVLRAPRMSALVTELDLPLPDPASPDGASWLGARLAAALDLDGVEGTIALPGEARESFTIEPMRAALETDHRFNLSLSGETRVALGAHDPGRLSIDLSAAGMVTNEGRLEPTKYALARARVFAEGLPTALVQPLVDPMGLDLARAFGPEVSADVRAGVLDEARFAEMVGGEPPDLPDNEPYLAATIDSRETTLRADVFLASERLRTRNEGVEIQTDAAGYFARWAASRVPALEGLTLDGRGNAIVEIKDVDVPASIGDAEIGALSARVRAVLGGLTATLAQGESPVRLDSLDVGVRLSPDEPAAWSIDTRAQREGAPFAVVGGGTIDRLDPGTRVDRIGAGAATLRPVGQLRLIDVPTALAGVGGADAATLASELLGGSLTGVVITKPHPDGPAGRYALGVELETPRAALVGHATLDDERLAIGDSGLKLDLYEPERGLAALSRLGMIPSEVSVSSTGPAAATLRNVDLPIADVLDGAPLRRATAQAELSAGPLAATIRGPEGEQRVDLASIGATADLGTGRTLRLTAAGEGSSSAGPVSIDADLSADGLLGETGAIDPDGAAFSGRATVAGLPTSLAALADPALADAARESVGATVDLTIEAERRDTLAISATAEHARLDSTLVASGDTIELRGTRATARVAGGTVAYAAALAGLDPAPTLRAPTTLDLAAASISLAPGGGSSGVAVRDATLASSAPIVLSDLPIETSDPDAAIAIHGLRASVARLDGSTLDASASATLHDPNAGDAPLGSLAASASRDGAGGLVAEVELTGVRLAEIDRALAAGGRITEWAGDTLEARASVTPGGVVADVRAPRLTLNADLARTDAGYDLRRPVEARLTVTPGALQAAIGGEPGSTPPARLARDATVTATIDRLSLGPGATPMAPGRFDLGGRVSFGELELLDEAGQRFIIPATSLRLSRGAAHDRIDFEIERSSASGATTPLRGRGTVSGLADVDGRLTPVRAVVSAQIDGELPTPLLDSLGRLDGLATDLIGPVVRIERLNLVDFSPKVAGGTLDFACDSDYADTQLGGAVTAPGTVRVRAGGVASINQITNDASERIFGVLFPFLESFEKRPGDEPARMTILGMDVPADGDIAKLDGEATLELGVMQFKTRGFFERLLKKTSNDTFGEVGKNVGTIELRADRGVLSYDRVEITANDFVLTTWGKIDLVERRMDVYVLVPAYAFSGELSKLTEGIPVAGQLLRGGASIPLRFRGPFDSPSTEVDAEEWVRNIGRSPQNLIEGILGGGQDEEGGGGGGLLEDLIGGGRKKDKDDKK